MKEKAVLNIVIAGTRGIPARYGGFETFAEEISYRLKNRGHRVVVYGRRKFFEKSLGLGSLHGVEIRYAPTILHKYLETPLASLTTFLSLIRNRCDVVLLCNAANSPFAWIPRLFGIPVVINVDGIERKRAKWNALGRFWYRLGEISSVLFGSRVIGDAEVISDYYRERYRCKPVMIPYGARAKRRPPGEVLRKFGISSGKYLLYVSRLEPENNALGVVEAFKGVETSMPLVIVGDAPYAKEYIEEVKRAAGPNVIFTGFQFGEAYEELQSNCYLYIQATEVGGTHPALIEAMAYGNCVIANGTPENIEVLGEAGELYRQNDFMHLRAIISDLVAFPSKAAELGANAKIRVQERYDWEVVANQYEALLKEVTGTTTTTGGLEQPKPSRTA